MSEMGLPTGDFPGTNTKPVLDGIRPVTQQDLSEFADEVEVEF